VARNAVNLALTEPRIVGLILFDPVCYPDRGYRARAIIAKYANPARYISWLKRHRLSLTRPTVTRQIEEDSIDPLEFRDAPPPDQLREAFELVRERGGRVLSVFTNYALRYYNQTGQLGRALSVKGYQQFRTELFWSQVGHTCRWSTIDVRS
jgi:hypothetical protein